MNGVLVTPTPIDPTVWATVYAGDTHVVVDQFSPSAISTPEVAILAVCLFGFSFLVILGVFLLLRRNV